MILKMKVITLAGYMTHQKECVLLFLAQKRDTPYSMEEITEGVYQLYGGLAPGKSSVYRIIHNLCEEGRVRRFVKENSRQFLYQLADSQSCQRHLHMKCTSCGKILHMNDAQSEALLQQVLGSANFSVNKEQTTLFGCCEECRKNGA